MDFRFKEKFSKPDDVRISECYGDGFMLAGVLLKMYSFLLSNGTATKVHCLLVGDSF